MSVQTIRIPASRTSPEDQFVVEVDTTPDPAPLAAPTADAAPLGMAGFALTTFVLSIFNANIINNPPLQAVVLPVAVFYGGLVLILAGMWEFRKGNTFGGTAFTSFGAFWLSFAAYVKYIAPGLPAADAHQATGLFILSWAIFAAYMTAAALKTPAALFATFAALTATLILLTWGAFASSTTITHLGGYVGLATAALAWYVSAAGILATTFGRSVLPLGPTTI